ncbi:uncharacterized protein FOMMEDRAFT_150417 [Fomitiporia mediterranea MF3/22]|uniref:uncharacterized protein n=1 Tax=Fomitiporia mediterranea (strain MF3/22) TaxID=694068 RepID=UPI00044077DC|nr:uncharacterized protein FOMMEDRAFT_150417 [Fomitiporia mediterranea MF3/22]EJD07836.1 hypothetical protein FOMMEDRAFT_150417 [Fomitiporia mediterranea MF3/22]
MAVEWLIGRHPYLHDNEEKEIQLIEEHAVDFDRRFRTEWKNITPQGQRFIKETTCVDKDKRLDVDKALGHEWFTLIEKPDGEVPERFLRKTHRVIQDQVRREVKRIRFNRKKRKFEITVNSTSRIGRMLVRGKQQRQSSGSSQRHSNASSHHSTRSTRVGEKKGPSRLQKKTR